jgi:homocysteine S-methyltransferase
MGIEYPLLIDGGLSNVLESNGHDLNNKLWAAQLLETDPEAIIQAHFAYLVSGARCITTASYQASINGFMEMGHDQKASEELLLRSVKLAEKAIERALISGHINTKPLIAASIGPYGAYLADGSEYRGKYGVSEDVLKEFHSDRIRLLDNSNADLFACETIPSFQEAKVLGELLTQTSKPSWISFSCKNGEQLNDGTAIEECVSLFADHPKVFAIGVNCTAPKYVSTLITAIKKQVGSKKIVIYPNSGEAYNAKSRNWIGVSNPKLFVSMTEEWIALGADIIGGCCRIGPDHIKAIREEVIYSSGR